jgi:hypothetical protein
MRYISSSRVYWQGPKRPKGNKVFIQIVTFSTDRIGEVTDLLDYVDSSLITGLELFHDTEIPTRYFIVIGFESKAIAELNNKETQDLGKRLRELCTGGPIYTYMEHLDTCSPPSSANTEERV